jgi:hypothetical protein
MNKFLRKIRGQDKIDNLQEDKKFEYFVRFNEFPIMPVNLITFTAFFGIICLTIFSIYIVFLQTGVLEEFKNQLQNILVLFYLLIKIKLILIMVDIMIYIWNVCIYTKEKKEFLNKYGK